jgi:hypothetical protein
MSEPVPPGYPGVLGKSEIIAYLGEVGEDPSQVFLMKLLAGRAPDHDDMVALWALCDFGDAQAAVDAYHLAYPFEESDPYLVDYVQQIADLAAPQPPRSR